MKKNGVKSFCFLGLIIAIILLVIYYYNTDYNLNFVNNLENFSQQDPMVEPPPPVRPRVFPRSDETQYQNQYQNSVSLPPNDPRQYVPYNKQVRYNTYGTEYVPPGQPPTVPPRYNTPNALPLAQQRPSGPTGPNGPNGPPPNVSNYLIGQNSPNVPGNYLYPSVNYTTYDRGLPYFARSPEIRTNADGTIPAGTLPPGFNINSEGRLVPTTNILPISYYNS